MRTRRIVLLLGSTALRIIGASTILFTSSVPSTADAQVGNPVTASLSEDTLKTQVGQLLARFILWPSGGTGSEANVCQQIFGSVCIAEHNQKALVVPGVTRLLADTLSDKQRVLNDADSSRMLAQLSSAIAQRSDNGWFVGHKTLYHLIQLQFDSAAVAVGQCRSLAYWCHALQGFLAHADWRFAASDSLFALALSEMNPELSCQWRDMTPLLDATVRTEYSRLSCEERQAAEAMLWWLADPLYLTQGNDRRTEHFTRQVLKVLYSGLPSVDDDPLAQSTWGDDLNAMLLRYGIAGHWIAPPKDKSLSAEGGGTWLHYHTPNYSFFPTGIQADWGSPIPVEAFRLTVPLDSARERYRPGYGFVTDIGQAQIATFSRGDSTVVLTASAIDLEPFAPVAPFVGMLSAWKGPQQLAGSTIARSQSQVARFKLEVPTAPTLLSLEYMSHDFEVAARLRFGLNLPERTDAPSLSDLVMISAGSAPASLDEVLSRMLGSSIAITAEPLGLYWELANVPNGTPIEYSVVVAPLDSTRPVSLFGRIKRSLGLATGEEELLISWEARAIASQSGYIGLSLGRLKPRQYELALRATMPDGTVAEVRREVVVATRRSVQTLEDALDQVTSPLYGGAKVRTPVTRRSTPIPPSKPMPL